MTVRIEVRKYQMPFGKFIGDALEDVPLKYLDWLVGETNLKIDTPITYKHIVEYLEDPVISNELKRILDDEE